MKPRCILFVLLLPLLFSSIVQAQTPPYSTQDSISIFYNELFEVLETRFLFRKEVNWTALKPEIEKRAFKCPTFEKSLEMCTPLFDTIKGDHLHLFSENGWYKSTLPPELAQSDFHIDLLKHYVEGPPFMATVLEGGYGYVFVPSMPLIHATPEQIDSNSQAMYDAIVAIDSTTDIKGWIIDLRLNTGGNAYTMLAGLYHLLGDSPTYLSLDVNMNVTEFHHLKEGGMYENEEQITKVAVKMAPKPNIPVALISGIMTGSAGEFVILGFRGRENILVIGETSYGLLTGNDLAELPFGAKFAITESYGTDRKARWVPKIVPEVEVIKQANFEDLTKDQNIIEAIRFIDSVPAVLTH